MQSPGSNAIEPPALRFLRGLVRLGLTTIIAFLVSLVVLALLQPLQQVFRFTFVEGSPEKSNPRDVLLFVMLAMNLAGGLFWAGRRLSWRALAIGYAIVSPVMIYLAVDSPRLRRPLTMEEFSPVFPGAEASYQVLMRYGKRHPAGRDFTGSKLMTWVGYDPQKPEPWIKFVTDHRATLEAEWQALKPARDWWDELNTFERIGDLSPANPDVELLAFRPIRELSQRACAIATLRALDGRGDEAMKIVIPLIEVARKLQPSARTLVNVMIAMVIERMSIHTAGLVLDRTTVSSALRTRLAAVLAAPGGGEAGARRLILIEYVQAVNYFADRPLGDCLETVMKNPTLRHALNAVGPFVYNPRTSLNLLADLMTDLEDIVAHRELNKIGQRGKSFYEQEARPGFKNLAGAMLANEWVPALDKVSVSYWQTQDGRAALLARVTAP